MRQIIAVVIIISLILFFQTGCLLSISSNIDLQPAGSSQTASSNLSASFSNSGDGSSFNTAPLIIGFSVILAATLTYLYYSNKHYKTQYALTPAGEKVSLIFHAEAPPDAILLGEIHTRSHTNLNLLKNDLRNQAARMGGDIVVVDDIQPKIPNNYNQQVSSRYVSMGRVYKTRASQQNEKD
ncbi:MAG: hypothetical protein PHU81_03835 [Acidobacteriota bacterium]|nr:hypothetical protein [Acidobacteriota bacterium]